VSFVDVFGLPDDDAPGAQRWQSPSWFGAPDGELGVCVPVGAVIGRSDAGVVAISHAITYSTGISFELIARARGLKRSESQRVFHEQHLSPTDGEELSSAFLRVGVELADGTRLSNLGGRHPWHDADRPPPGPILLQQGGGGGMSDDRNVTMRPAFWLWPLPPEGLVRLSCEWPIVDIGLSSVELDGGSLRAASASSLRLWPT
jgi:hypothetical protein